MDSNQKPFFSICIPNYNYGMYIEETIRSVIGQTFSDFEIIIADNCSTDNSLKIIANINDSRIRIIHNKVNVGMSLNLDVATKYANGDFIILLSSDDLMKPTALESYHEIIEKNFDFDVNNLVLFSSFDIIDGYSEILIADKPSMPNQVKTSYNNNIIKGIEFYDGVLISGRDAVKVMLKSTLGSTGQFCTTCYSRVLFSKLEGYSSFASLIADATFIHKLGLNGAMFFYSNRNLFQYRIHNGNNLTATQKMNNIKLLIDNYLIACNYDKLQLEKIGLSNEDLESTFVNHYIFHGAFWSFVRGGVLKGIRLLAFGVAAYPNKVLWNIRFLGLNLMVLITPLLGILFKLKKLLQGNKK